jgi:hypothetical protein
MFLTRKSTREEAMRTIIRIVLFVFATVLLTGFECETTTRSGDDGGNGGNGGEIEYDYTYPPFRVIRYSTDFEAHSGLVAAGREGIGLVLNIFVGHRVLPTESRIDLNDVWAESAYPYPDSIFVVGDKNGYSTGLIYRFLNGKRLRMSHPIDGDVTSVHGTAWNNVFAVGNDGAMARYNGEEWSYVNTADPGIILYDVWTGKYDDAWAVGNDGEVIHYSGGPTWREFTVPGDNSCLSVWGLSPDTVFVAANNEVWLFHEPVGSEAAGELLETAVYTIDDIHVTSNAFGMAVGSFGMTVRMEFSSWTTVHHGSTTLRAVATSYSGSRRASVFGYNGASYLYHGTEGWTRLNLATKEDWVDFHGTSLGSAPVYGILGGRLMRYGGDWTQWEWAPEVSEQTLTALFCTGENEVWATAMPTNPSAIDRSAYFFNGAFWMGRWLSSMYDQNDIWCEDRDKVCIVGDHGSVWYSVDHPIGGWIIETGWGGTNEHLRGVWGDTYDNVYAVGDAGAIVKGTIDYDGATPGATWTPMTSGTTVNLHDVWGWGPNSVVAIGDAGTVLYYNGSAWTPMSTGVTEDLYSVWCSGYDNIFAATRGNIVLHWDGSQWERLDTKLPTAPIRRVWGEGSTVYFACEKDYVLVYSPLAP